MGHNPRYNRWTAINWAGYAPTVGDIIARDCREARCPRCRLAFKVRLSVVARMKGRRATLWGAHGPCPFLDCPARVYFIFHAPRGEGGPFDMESLSTLRVRYQ